MKQKKFASRILDLIPVLSVVILLLGWYILSSVRPDLFPTYQSVFARAVRLFVKPVSKINLFGHVGASLLRVLVGYLSACVLGIAFGVLIGWSKGAKALLGTIFEMLRPVPALAWVPLLVMNFGIGEFPKYLIVFIGAFTPIVINTYTGMRLVDDIYIKVGTICNAGRKQMLTEIAVPGALPAIFAGLRTATSSAWLCVLAAEMLGAKSGLGFLITTGMNNDDMALIMVCMICIGVIGAILAFVTSYMERWLCPWLRRG